MLLQLISLVAFFSPLLIQVMQMFTMTSLGASQPLLAVVIEDEDDDIQFMFQIDRFNLSKKSNVEVDGAWALLTPLFLANKDVWYLGIAQ
jgi:hypothetical protein